MLFLRLFIDKPNVELFFHFASGQEADIPTCTPPNSPPPPYTPGSHSHNLLYQ